MIDKSIDWYLDWYLVFNRLIGIQSTKGEESGQCPERKKERGGKVLQRLQSCSPDRQESA